MSNANITYFFVTDSDGNPLSAPRSIKSSGYNDHQVSSPDEAIRTAHYYVNAIWEDYEEGRICGFVNTDPRNSKTGHVITLLRFSRVGPPPSSQFRKDQLSRFEARDTTVLATKSVPMRIVVEEFPWIQKVIR